MENWKVKVYADDESPEVIAEIEECFKKSLGKESKQLSPQQKELDKIKKEIKEEKKLRRRSLTSIVTRLGLAIMFVGGIISSALCMALIKDPTIASACAGIGFGSAVAGLLTPFALDLAGSDLMELDIKDDIKNSQEAKENIAYLKKVQRELQDEMEMVNA